MRFQFHQFCLLWMALASWGTVTFADDPIEQQMLFDFNGNFDIQQIEARGVRLSLVGAPADRQLKIESQHDRDWPGITLKPPTGHWDGSAFQKVSFDITNLQDDRFELGLRIDNPDGDKGNNHTVMSSIGPGETRTITGKNYTTSYRFSTPLKLEGMQAAPGQTNLAPAQIVQIILFLRQPTEDHAFTIDNVRFETSMTEKESATFLPFIDRYGQFVHEQWPGKILSNDDLLARKKIETVDLDRHPRPKSFNRYGGWSDGPLLEPSEFFRTAKLEGKWWLVDPSGRLFWSHGIDSVDSRFGVTGISDRESYFRNLPANNDPLAQFYGSSTWAYGFYAPRVPFKTYNFLNANLYRKYGTDWRQQFATLAHRRVNSWGMNTLASWADPEICRQQRTPYVAFVHVKQAPALAGAQRRWTQFHDVFDPKFRRQVAAGIQECKFAIGDSWCLGFFVDNELFWGSPTDLAIWTLTSPASQAAKVVFVDQLKQKHESIDRLNESWKTSHDSWTTLLESVDPPDASLAKEDLIAFTKTTSETYFRTVQQELDNAAPNQLYLGCRFIWDNPTAVQAASQFCDVVSFNRYLYTVGQIKLPTGSDRPIVIGEFHFGATDRGAFHASKTPSKNQQHRAECYTRYVRSALQNPQIVGTHWFAYQSQPTSGRGDGENYHIGFVDGCDTPYQELVDAARAIGSDMYSYRSQFDNQKNNSQTVSGR